MPQLQVSVTGFAPTRPPAIAALYTATVATSVIVSSVDLQQQPLSPPLRATLAEAPGWVSWPPTQLPAGFDVAALTDLQLVLFRLKALFDFGAGLTGEAAASLSQAIDNEWPSFAAARRSVAAGRATATYEQATVSAEIDVNGDPTWGFQPNVNGATPLPIPNITPASGRPEYDRVLQNLVRVDLLQRIEATL